MADSHTAYVDVATLREYLPKAGDEDVPALQKLILRASRSIDKAVGVPAGWYGRVDSPVEEIRAFYPVPGGQYILLPPFAGDHVTLYPKDSEPVEIPVVHILNTSAWGEFNSLIGYENPPALYAYVVFNGALTRQDGTRLADEVYAIGAAWGFTDAPDDVQEAVLQLAVFRWRSKDSGFSGVLGQMQDGGALHASTGWPKDVRDTISALRSEAISRGWITV